MPLVLLNKPCQVLCQFRDPDGRATLADYVDTPNVYPAGRLDYDSEGLLLLTDDGGLQARISQPRSRRRRPTGRRLRASPPRAQLDTLLRGVDLKDGRARAHAAQIIDEPEHLWPRQPPIRYRANVPDHWIEVTISEGRNRQVRRMTAAVGLPTLRLIRCAVGPWALDGLAPGETREESNAEAWSRLASR